MTVRAVVLPLLYLSAFAQQPSPRVLVGTIEKVFGREIQLQSGQKSITLYADDRTTVSRDAVYHDLSALNSGDEVSVRYTGDTPDKLVAFRIWAKVTTFRGVVKEVTPGTLLVGMRVVRTYPETVFSPGSRSAAIGQELEITGLDLGNGEVDAVRIAVLNTDMPLTAK